MPAVTWKSEPDDHDYPAAADYLGLLAAAPLVAELTTALRGAPVEYKKAKDILRAAGLALLPVDNPHVKSDLDKIAKGKALSPILLIRGDLTSGVAVQIADGYHRVCASYYSDENTDIPAKIVAPK